MGIRTRGILAALTLAAAGALAAPAVAGGGCEAGKSHSRAEGERVDVQGCAFRPTLLFVAPGTTVEWVHADHVPHNVVGVGWGSAKTFQQGETASHTFTEAGIYPYQCSLHPGMAGAVIVGDGALAGEQAGEAARVAGVSADRQSGDLASAAPSGTPDPSLALALLAGALAVAGGVGIGRRVGR